MAKHKFPALSNIFAMICRASANPNTRHCPVIFTCSTTPLVPVALIGVAIFQNNLVAVKQQQHHKFKRKQTVTKKYVGYGSAELECKWLKQY